MEVSRWWCPPGVCFSRCGAKEEKDMGKGSKGRAGRKEKEAGRKEQGNKEKPISLYTPPPPDRPPLRWLYW